MLLMALLPVLAAAEEDIPATEEAATDDTAWDDDDDVAELAVAESAEPPDDDDDDDPDVLPSPGWHREWTHVYPLPQSRGLLQAVCFRQATGDSRKVTPRPRTAKARVFTMLSVSEQPRCRRQCDTHTQKT